MAKIKPIVTVDERFVYDGTEESAEKVARNLEQSLNESASTDNTGN